MKNETTKLTAEQRNEILRANQARRMQNAPKGCGFAGTAETTCKRCADCRKHYR